MSIKLKDTIYDLIDNADKLDGVHNGNLTAKYFAQGDILTSSDTINKLMSGIYCYINANNPTGSIDDNAILLSFRNSGRTDMIQFVGAANSEKLYYRRAANIGNQYENWTDWKTIAFIDSKVNSAGYADSAGTANSVAWGNVSGKPSSFTPSSHTHTKSQITDFAHTHDYAATSHTHTKAQITDFSHTHNYAGSSSAGGAATSANKLNTISFSASTDINFDYTFWTAGGACSDVSSMGYAAVMNVGSDLYRGWQIWNSRNDHKLYWRPAISDASAWKSTPHIILDSNNWSSYCAPSSHTHTKAQITDFSHTHNYAGSSSAGGSATTAVSLYTGSVSGTSHANALQTYFNSNKSSIPRGKTISFYSSAYSNGSQYMGYFLSGYDTTPYGGFFCAHYDDCYYIGISYGTFSEQRILTSTNWSSYCAPASHTHSQYLTSLPSHSHSYYPLSGNTNMSGDNVWIGSTMGGGTDYWRIGGYGSSDNGICRITIGDNYNDKFQVQIADYSGTTYTPLEVTYNKLNVVGLTGITANGRTLTIGSQNADHCHYSTDAPCHWFNKLVRVAGDVYGGSSYNRRLAYVDEVALSGHTHNYAGSDTPGGGANSVRNTGFGNGNFTWYQSSSSFFGSNWSSGWASYLISNHGDGKTYYNVTIALPFWGVPHYKRLEGGTEKGWYAFITAENIGSQSVNYANSAGSVAWGNVSGKPSSFTPSSHTHNYAGSSSAGGAATSANKLNTNAGSATKPVYFTNGVPTACTYGFNGAYGMPVVLAAGYIYKNSYTSTTWAFSGSYCPALTGGITTSVSGGVLAVTWTAASGRSRYIYGAVANMRTSGAVTSYSGTEYKDRSLGMYWLGTATSTTTTYIRAMCQGNENNDTGMSYAEMWGTSSQQSDHCILSFSIIVIGYWT